MGDKSHSIFYVLFGTLLYVSVVLLNPMIMQFTIDHIASNNQITSRFARVFSETFNGIDWIRGNLWIIAVLVVALSFISGLALYIRNKAAGSLAEHTVQNLRNDLYNHIQKLPFEYHVTVKTGDLIQRATSDIEQISNFINNQIRELMYAILMIFVAMFILFNINAELAKLSMLVFPVIFVFAIIFFKKMQDRFRESDEAEAAMSSVFQESLDGVRVVKAFNRELYEIERFDKRNREYRDKTEHMIKLMGVYWGTSDFLCFLQILIVLISSLFMVRNGTLSLGNAVVFISYVSMVIWPLRNVGRILADMGKLSIAIERLQEVLNADIENLEIGETPQLKGNIEFKNVSFKYPDAQNEVLTDISFTVDVGETVAIMGPTGSGKSSLVLLLTKLYNIDQGDILFDGVSIKNIAKKSLREQIGIVLQEPFLFSKTIGDNIKIAAQDFSYSDVENAARMASVHDVITEFDQGYETIVGEKGVTLSGGQKQRVAIARTLLLNQKIVVFDDSLSALDAKTDLKIRQALEKREHEASTLIITHRVNTAMHADKIIVIDQGKIVQVGSHDSLLNEDGIYQRIASIQTQGRSE
ncbi:ABC transporter ATP-binding protein [Erysipelothrix urinaevulpis]